MKGNDRVYGDDSGDATSAEISMAEVAQLAGVAISSVSRTLSGHQDVSKAMRRRVMSAVEQLGYEPNFLAQSLRRGATLSVGFVCRDIASPLQATVASGAEEALREGGYAMLLMGSAGKANLDAEHIRFLQTRRVDGMMLALTSENELATLQALSRLTTPGVLVDRELPSDLGLSSVLSDHRAGVLAAANHLLSLGHERLGLVSGPLDVLPNRERMAAVKEAFQSAGLREQIALMPGPFTDDHGYDATLSLVDSEDAPTAIIAGSHQLLVGCLRALRQRGKAVGSDISLVACDETEVTQLFEPAISVVKRDSRRVGRESAALLLRLIEGGEPQRVELPTQYVARGSCQIAHQSPARSAGRATRTSAGARRASGDSA